MKIQRTAFDIGMYDGLDTKYYLELGLRVVAVEANPSLVESAMIMFGPESASGQFVCVNAAITPDGNPMDLVICGADLGSSTIFKDRIENLAPSRSIRVSGTTLADLFSKYGVPYYLKVDIEGADYLCIMALTRNARPDYVSFELSDDFAELVQHLETLGYRKFRAINQCSFHELTKECSFGHRMKKRVLRRLGYRSPVDVLRGERRFVAGHSSGPAPWLDNEGWHAAPIILAEIASAMSHGRISGWYDIQATYL
jgi:FkbM family methyltransferase